MKKKLDDEREQLLDAHMFKFQWLKSIDGGVLRIDKIEAFAIETSCSDRHIELNAYIHGNSITIYRDFNHEKVQLKLCEVMSLLGNPCVADPN